LHLVGLLIELVTMHGTHNTKIPLKFIYISTQAS
jgi:hypothetical protein